MPAKINLSLEEDNTLVATFEGNTLQFSLMLKRLARKNISIKHAIYLAAGILLLDEGYLEPSQFLHNKVMKELDE